jgi:hypothetical protein
MSRSLLHERRICGLADVCVVRIKAWDVRFKNAHPKLARS